MQLCRGKFRRLEDGDHKKAGEQDAECDQFAPDENPEEKVSAFVHGFHLRRRYVCHLPSPNVRGRWRGIDAGSLSNSKDGYGRLARMAALTGNLRPEERRVGKEWISTFR